MNQAHLHLLFNHLPVFGSILGAIVLAYGMRTKSIQTQNASFIVFIISAIGAAVTYLTGEGAEEVIENIQGISESMIEEHEEFALFSFIAILILGVISVIGLVLSSKNSAFSSTLAKVTLILSILSFGLMAKTGNSGGKIRHSELNPGAVTQGGGAEKEEGDED